MAGDRGARFAACQHLFVQPHAPCLTLLDVNPRNSIIVLVGAALLFSANAAVAERPIDGVSLRAPAPERNRWTFGTSVGRGSIAIECPICDDVDPLSEAFSFSLHAGYMLTPRLSIVGEYWTIRYNNRGSDWFPDSKDHAVIQNIVTVSGQLWLTKALYLRAGIGVGHHQSESLYTKPHLYESETFLRARRMGVDVNDSEEARSLWAPATTFGIGYEFAHTTRFAADVQFRVGRTAVNDDKYAVTNTGLTFGVAWY